MTNFESAKRSFGTSEHSQKWRIPVASAEDDESKGIEDNELELRRYAYEPDRYHFPRDSSAKNNISERMAEFFDPVVGMIVGLAARQIKDANDKSAQSMVSVGWAY